MSCSIQDLISASLCSKDKSAKKLLEQNQICGENCDLWSTFYIELLLRRHIHCPSPEHRIVILGNNPIFFLIKSRLEPNELIRTRHIKLACAWQPLHWHMHVLLCVVCESSRCGSSQWHRSSTVLRCLSGDCSAIGIALLF